MYQKKGKEHFGFKHGLSGSLLYKKWCGMKRRCLNKNEKSYPRYGGRGIGISPEWMFFINFQQDMEDSFKEGLSLERIDNDKGYSKENCKWITLFNQAKNKRSVKKYSFRGENLCLAEIARKYGKPRSVIRDRLSSGWTLEKAVDIPLQEKGKGVSYDKARGKWRAYCNINSKRFELGRFNSKEEAEQECLNFLADLL